MVGIDLVCVVGEKERETFKRDYIRESCHHLLPTPGFAPTMKCGGVANGEGTGGRWKKIVEDKGVFACYANINVACLVARIDSVFFWGQRLNVSMLVKLDYKFKEPPLIH